MSITRFFDVSGTTAENSAKKASAFLYNQNDSSLYYSLEFKRIAEVSGDLNQLAEACLLVGINQTLLGNTHKGLACMKQAMDLFQQLENEKGIAECNLNMGEVYYNWAEYDKALYYFLEGFRVSKINHLKNLEVTALNGIGKYYHSTGDFSKSIENYQKAFLLANEIKDTLGIVAIQNKIGKHFETLGNYPLALEYYLNAEGMLAHIHNAIELATTYNHIGNLYHLLKEYDEAILFHKLALTERKNIHYLEGEAKSFNNLGEVYMDINKTDSALHYFELSNVWSEKLGYTKGIIKSVQNQGEVYFLQHDYDKASVFFRNAMETSKSVNYTKGILKALLKLSDIEFCKGDYEQAIRYATEGFALSELDSIYSRQRDFSQQLAKIYESEGESKRALAYYKLFHTLDAKITNLQSSNQLAELETRFEVRLKERENEVLKKDNEIKALKLKRKNAQIFLIALVLLLMMGLVAFVFYLYKIKLKANAQLHKLNEEMLQKKLEMEELNQKLNESIKQQVRLFSIIGHELRNPLWWFRNLVQMLASRFKSLDKTTIEKSLHSLNESATQTFHLMDNLLHWSRSQLGHIRYSPELFDIQKVIKENIDLTRQIAQFKQLTIAYQHNSQMVYADKNMVQTVVRNLLSNAIKFTPNGGNINIQFEEEGQFLRTRVEDTGVGMDQQTLQTILEGKQQLTTADVSRQAGNGLGLTLCREFVELNKGIIQVNSRQGKGSAFSFTLPLE